MIQQMEKKNTSRYMIQGNESVSQRGICKPMATVVLFTVAKMQKQPQCLPMNKWVRHGIYMWWNIQPKKKHLGIYNNMDEPGKNTLSSEVSQILQHKHFVISLIYEIQIAGQTETENWMVLIWLQVRGEGVSQWAQTHRSKKISGGLMYG